MFDKVSNVVDCGLIASGMAIGISNIRNIIGLIVVGIQLVWILTKIIYAVIKKIKKGGNLDSIDHDVDRLTDKIEDVADRFFDDKGGGKQ